MACSNEICHLLLAGLSSIFSSAPAFLITFGKRYQPIFMYWNANQNQIRFGINGSVNDRSVLLCHHGHPLLTYFARIVEVVPVKHEPIRSATIRFVSSQIIDLDSF
jgi:hypothetical protein